MLNNEKILKRIKKKWNINEKKQIKLRKELS
jgi:hypothetical protein